MLSQYIAMDEAASLGLADARSDQIQAASTLVDMFLNRPEGLVWAPDSQGNPAYMLAADPVIDTALTTEILPGSNVAVTLSGGLGMIEVGDALVIDAENSKKTETCVVATTTPLGITLQTVINEHDIGASVQKGLLIEEKKYMPQGRPLTRASRTPLLNVVSGVGRYGYGRRGDSANYDMEQFNLLAALSKFGGPPVWELWQQPLNNCWDMTTGQIWVPAGIMLAYYSEVKVRYVAGFPVAGIPGYVKAAVAQLVRAQGAVGPMGDVKSFKAGDTSLTRFTSSVIDADTRRLLRSLAARSMS